MTHALVRVVSRTLSACELVHAPRQPIDFLRAVQQHNAYVGALESAGITVTVLPEAPEFPDATFVEDTVVYLDELAVICRPATPSRQPEAALMRGEVESGWEVATIVSPGTLEGGDVLRVGRSLYVGLSGRTNEEGISQFAAIVGRFGYNVIPVVVRGCLHLKTAVTVAAPGLLVANRDRVDVTRFPGIEILGVPRDESWGANTLRVNDRVFVAASATQTANLLRNRGLAVQSIDISELQKAEAGLTCLSVLYSVRRTVAPSMPGGSHAAQH